MYAISLTNSESVLFEVYSPAKSQNGCCSIVDSSGWYANLLVILVWFHNIQTQSKFTNYIKENFLLKITYKNIQSKQIQKMFPKYYFKKDITKFMSEWIC